MSFPAITLAYSSAVDDTHHLSPFNVDFVVIPIETDLGTFHILSSSRLTSNTSIIQLASFFLGTSIADTRMWIKTSYLSSTVSQQV